MNGSPACLKVPCRCYRRHGLIVLRGTTCVHPRPSSHTSPVHAWASDWRTNEAAVDGLSSPPWYPVTILLVPHGARDEYECRGEMSKEPSSFPNRTVDRIRAQQGWD